jgi:flagellar motor protein MotB
LPAGSLRRIRFHNTGLAAQARIRVFDGKNKTRLSAEGYGEQFPVADNTSEEGRSKNRRVSMRVTQK